MREKTIKKAAYQVPPATEGKLWQDGIDYMDRENLPRKTCFAVYATA